MPSNAEVTVRPLRKDDVAASAAILERLPQWFGVATANDAYVESLARLPAFVAIRPEAQAPDAQAVVGFLAIEQHHPNAAEITVMGVDPELHRLGIGDTLVRTARSAGVAPKGSSGCMSRRVDLRPTTTTTSARVASTAPRVSPSCTSRSASGARRMPPLCS